MSEGQGVPAFVPEGYQGHRQVHIDYTHEGRVAHVTWNPPKKLNPLTIELTNEVVAAVEEVQARDGLHVVIFRGAGGTFCCGDDLVEMYDGMWGDPNQVMRRIRFYQQFAQKIE